MKELIKRTCPDCGSDNISTEKRIDGDSICGDCKYKDKTEKFKTEYKNVRK